MLTGCQSVRIVAEFSAREGAEVLSKKGAELLQRALSLPPEERTELADRLLTSLDPAPDEKIDALWAELAERRLDAYERGEIKAVSAKDGFKATDDAER